MRLAGDEAEATVVQGALNFLDFRKQLAATQPSVEVAANVIDREKFAIYMGQANLHIAGRDANHFAFRNIRYGRDLYKFG